MLLDEADVCGLQCLPYVDDKVSAVVIDAMHVVHRWSFRPGETFKDVESRYLHHILSDVPPNTESVHFCCDRYDHVPSLKCIERERRNRPNLKKVYDIQNHLQAPAFRDFVAAHDNKAALLKYLSETWSSSPSRCTRPLYLCGGFSDQTVTMVVDDNRSERVPSLSSTEEEADLRIMMHVLYSASFLGAQRIIVHANDTDVIVLCIYYCAKYPAISELWVRTDIDMFIPIHQIAASLGKEKCMLLPYFHAFSGKDDTSFIYGLGKKKLWKALTHIDTKPLEVFAELPHTVTDNIPEELVASSKQLVIMASGGKRTDTLASLRTQKFLAGKSGLLLNLPPTEDALEQHIKRAALSTILSKSTEHNTQTSATRFTSYGWLLQSDNKLKPVMMTKKSLPPNLETIVNCKCKKRCMGNCACSRNNVPCYSGCSCRGTAPTCTRAAYVEQDAEDEP